MVRKLAAAMLGIGVFIPGLANALGLGEIKLNSALSEPLDAEIELVQVRELTSSEILPALANESDFSSAHIERYHFLTDLRFNVVVNDKGRSVIKISSKKPVKEPFLNFLVEVNWPAGRLLREYTLLLDPPVYSTQKAAPVTQPTRAATTPKPVSNYQAVDQQQPYSSGGYAQSSAGDSSQVQTHTIGSNDSLWSIASDMKPSANVNIQQTMMAIQRNNPDAFIDNNINLLKKGQVLRAPTEEEAMAITSQEAIAMAAEQNRLWREKLESRGLTADTRQVDLTGRSVTREQDKAPSDDSARLKLVSGSEGGTSSGQGGSGSDASGSLRNDLAVAEESIDKFKLEKEELQLRVNDLEDQLETSEKVLTLKDEQIAALQAKLRELEQMQTEAAANAEAQTPVQTQEPAPIVVDEMPAQQDTGTEEQAMVSDEEAVEEDVDYNYQQEPAADTLSESDEAAAEAESEPVPEPESEEISAVGVIIEEPIEQPVQPAVVTTAEKPGILQQLLQNPLYLAAGGGAIIFLILLGLLAMRRKQNADELDDELTEGFQMPESDDDTMLELDSVDLDSDDDFEEAVEASAEEEIVPQTSDVIGEADIYIAYGRFPQAIEMLQNAADKEPDRSDIQLKLCEVCAEANEPSTFMKHYALLQTLGDASELAKANALKDRLGLVEESPEIDDVEDTRSFDIDSLEDTESAEVTAVDFSAPEAPDSFDFEIGESDSEQENSAELDADTSLDFDLGDLSESGNEFESHQETTDSGEAARTEEVAGLDFDLSLELDEAEDTQSTLADDSDRADYRTDSGAMDFDTDFSLDAVPESGNETTNLDEGLDFENLNSEEASESDESIAADDNSMDFDLEFDSSESAPEVPTVEPEPYVDSLKSQSDSIEDEPLIDSQSAAQLADELDLDLDGDFLSTDPGESTSVSESLDATDDTLADDIDVVTNVSSFDMTPAANDTGDSGDDLDFLSDEDEASTKLDLARAYIDMGDRDGAKDILDEVMIEGNDNQKQEAKDLLVRLES